MPNPCIWMGMGDDAATRMLALAPDYQFRADTVTLSAGNVATIPNRRGADALVLAAGTLAAPASDALFGGAQSLAFTGTQWLDSNLSASSWKFLHDGSGCEVFEISAATSGSTCVHWSTVGAGTAVGAQVYTSGSPVVYTFQINNGALPTPINQTAATNKAVGTAGYSNCSYSEASPLKYVIFADAAAGASGAPAAAPSVSNPTATFRLGAQSATNAFPASMKWCETLIFRRVLSEYERQIVREYISARYGIACPSVTGYDRDILSMVPFGWTRADLTTLLTGKVVSFLDKARPGAVFAQGNASFQVATPATNAGFNGQLTATFAGASSTRYVTNLPASAHRFLHNGAGMRVWVVHKPTANSGFLLANANGGITGMAISQQTAQLGFNVYGSGSPVVNTATGGTSPLGTPTYHSVRHKTGSSPVWSSHAKSALGASGSYLSPPQNADGQVLTLGTSTAATFGYTGDFAELLIFDRDPTADEVSRIHAAYLAKYGI